MTAKVVLLATRSAGKLRELHEIFNEYGIEVTDPGSLGITETSEEESLECYETFEENALAKARYFWAKSGGLPTFGDDSGLCVDALLGEPGVYSKRWSARLDLPPKALDLANNAKLVARMNEARSLSRASFTDCARYVCVAAFRDGAGEATRRGEIEGRILSEPRGHGGFGYDPYFEAPDLGGTFAEVAIEETVRHSHRSRAFRSLLTALRVEARL